MEIENPWREAHESKSALVWFLAGTTGLVVAPFANVPSEPVLLSSLVSFTLTGWRGHAAYKIWEAQANLRGKAVSVVEVEEILEYMRQHPDRLYLGKGFDWQQRHAQRLYDLRRVDVKKIQPPRWFMDLRRRWNPTPTSDGERGEGWIHGLELNEQKVDMPFRDLEGGTVIWGTTGAGKTRLLELLSTQLIHQDRESLIVAIDPKHDIDWRQRLQMEAKRAGKEFMYFNPAHPSRSIRLDPLKNWQRVTELASRVSSLISSGNKDVFKEFAWRAINQIVEALVEIEERPNLLMIRRFIEGGPDHLLNRSLVHYFEKNVREWKVRMEPYLKKANKGQFAKEASNRQTSNELMAMIKLYKSEIPEADRSSAIDGLISMFDHSREHQTKLLASLLPLLTQLTTGDIGKMLSPDGSDPNDQRPIMDTKKIIDGGMVLYVGLDALADQSVANAIGAIILSDLASVAGHRYNHGEGDKKKVYLIVDEATSCLHQPFISLLNKGRGAGFRVVFASQAFPDFEAALGDKAMAQQIIANANNMFALRTIEEETQQHITRTMGKTSVLSVATSQGINASTDSHPGHFSGGVSERISEVETEIFQPDMLGRLPNLHYLARVSGGRIVKGRIDFIAKHETPSLDDMSWVGHE